MGMGGNGNVESHSRTFLIGTPLTGNVPYNFFLVYAEKAGL